MKIVTYFAFTLLSILIQFGVMDFIQGKLQLDSKHLDLNASLPKKITKEKLQYFSDQPHALYYRMDTPKTVLPKKIIFNNSSLSDLTTTDNPNTIIDIFFEENGSIFNNMSTTETFFTSTDSEMVTELTLFEIKNETLNKQNGNEKETSTKHCFCNFMYKVCDINCCCDADCLEAEKNLFNCTEGMSSNGLDNKVCRHHLFHDHSLGNFFDDIFCIVKTNLPDKQAIQGKHKLQNADHYFKWIYKRNPNILKGFNKTLYMRGDNLWVLKDGFITALDLPHANINNYCTSRKPIRFLYNEEIKCNVKLSDIEMFYVKTMSEETSIISALNSTVNSTILNCTTLYCANWTVLVCNDLSCSRYNSRFHEPKCKDNFCINLVLKHDYIFNYYDSKIMNATIKFYIQNMSIVLPFFTQTVNVKFVMANYSLDNITHLSGSPGYVNGLPIIISNAESNQTELFYNSLEAKELKHFWLPENIHGKCAYANKTNNPILFGYNKRLQCKYTYDYVIKEKDKNNCKYIQSNITKTLNLIGKISVSPLGNPADLKDEHWIDLNTNTTDSTMIYEEYDRKNKKLRCYNLITRFIFQFAFVSIGDGQVNRIISTSIDVTRKNISFSVDSITALITLDISFIDVTKPAAFEYAHGPNLDIHLPADFFHPYRSTATNIFCNSFTIMLYVCILSFTNKITFH